MMFLFTKLLTIHFAHIKKITLKICPPHQKYFIVLKWFSGIFLYCWGDFGSFIFDDITICVHPTPWEYNTLQTNVFQGRLSFNRSSNVTFKPIYTPSQVM